MELQLLVLLKRKNIFLARLSSEWLSHGFHTRPVYILNYKISKCKLGNDHFNLEDLLTRFHSTEVFLFCENICNNNRA